MAEEYFEFCFSNEEDEFIYRSWVNRGFTPVPTKITACYLLQPSEKQLYTLLSSFMHGDKRTCFPSIEKLMGYSGWTRRTLKKHMDGLQKARIFTYIERQGTTNLYRKEDLHKSPTIIHSEMVHQIREEHFKRNECKFNELKDKYLESSLVSKVSNAADPIPFYEEIEAWFLNEGNLSGHVDEEKNTPSSMEETENPLPIEDSADFPSFEDGQKTPSIEETPKNSRLQGMASKSKNVKSMKDSGEFSVSADPDKVKAKKKHKDYKQVEIYEWNTHHFVKYFEDKYKQVLGFDLMTQRGDAAQIKALLERYKHVPLKERIDLFFSDDSFKSIKRNIYSFASGNIQSKLDVLLNSNKSNSYKDSRRPAKDSEKDDLQDWLNDLEMR